MYPSYSRFPTNQKHTSAHSPPLNIYPPFYVPFSLFKKYFAKRYNGYPTNSYSSNIIKNLYTLFKIFILFNLK